MKKEILRAARELNRVLGLEPKIDIRKPLSEIIELLKQAKDLLLADDVISDETMKILSELSKIENKKEKEMEEIQETEIGKQIAKDMKEGEEKKAKKTETKKREKLAQSNKAIVYLAWKNEKNKDPEQLLNLIKNRVKKATIIAWLKQWEKGKNLPAIANEEK